MSIKCQSSEYTFRRRNSASVCGGASVLLYLVDPATGALSFVLGKDHYGKQRWSDYGGGAKRGEKDYECGARELHEETHGIFQQFDTDYLRRLPKIVFKFPQISNPSKAMHYTTFLAQVERRDLNNMQDRFKQAFEALPTEEQTKVHVAEKAEIKLVDDINSVELRGFFKTRLQYCISLLTQPSTAFGRRVVYLYRANKGKAGNEKPQNKRTRNRAQEKTCTGKCTAKCVEKCIAPYCAKHKPERSAQRQWRSSASRIAPSWKGCNKATHSKGHGNNKPVIDRRKKYWCNSYKTSKQLDWSSKVQLNRSAFGSEWKSQAPVTEASSVHGAESPPLLQNPTTRSILVV